MNNKKAMYTLSGEVVHGRGRGRGAGMPTANLKPDPGAALPPCGVYAVRAEVEEGAFAGVTNVGLRPSVDSDTDITVETYLPGYSGDLYGKRMRLEFCQYLRPIRKFGSLDEVKAQVDRDAERALRYVKTE